VKSSAAGPGLFITFEGLDGTGKSTQINRLARALRKRGFTVVTTREPGGTPIGERIRSILLDSKVAGLSPQTEMALMFADRAQDVAQVIQPALRAGKIVLCDRYTDSSEAYQGFGRRLGSKRIRSMHALLCDDLWPDLTILLEGDAEHSVGRARIRNQRVALNQGGDEGRFEAEDRDFFSRVAEGFRTIAKREKNRVVVIDGRAAKDAVHKQVLKAIEARLPALRRGGASSGE
jgi:dTMP kinase